jgi:Zn-dependent peptidase ImmA (M78 family)
MMDEEKQKDSPRLTEAKHAAKGLLKSAKLKSAPTEIRQLIDAVKQTFDVTVKGVPDAMFSGKGDAITQTRDECVFILYNDSKSVVRKRFSVAHELGHLYIGHLHGNSSSDINSENFDEMEANTFAAHLLMPPDFLRKDIKAGIKNPDDLAKKYNVSVEALWLQLRSTGLFKLL